MTKIEYTTAIETNLATAEILCADLRNLRNLKRLANEIPGSDVMVSFDVLDKAVEEKEASLKTTRAELGKARRIVKKFEEIEGMEAEGEKPGKEDATPEPEAKTTTKRAGKKKLKADATPAADSAEGVAVEIDKAS